jgi:hypothetical protein
MQTELLRADDPAWSERLRLTSTDIYHSAGFHRCAEASDEGEARLAVVEEHGRGLAWPYLLRRVAEVPELASWDAVDVTSVYGYPGPVAWGCEPGDAFLARAWAELVGLWREERVVTAFTRFHPLLRNDLLAVDFRAPGEATGANSAVTQLGLTVSVDCTIEDEAAEQEYDPQVRRAVARSRRDGFTTFHDEEWTEFDAFRDLYRATMAHNNAAAYYFFPDAHFERLRAELPGHVHLMITHREGVVVAAGVMLEFGGIVQTYLSASDRGVRPSPKPLFYDDIRRWARARGNRVFHLGGGRGSKDDSLLQFKARFSNQRHPFSVGHWILDADLCRELETARAAGPGPGATLDPEFFPAYRSPLLGADREPSEVDAGIVPGG